MNARAQKFAEDLPRFHAWLEECNCNEGAAIVAQMESALRQGSTYGAMFALLPFVQAYARTQRHPFWFLLSFRLCMAEASFRDSFGV